MSNHQAPTPFPHTQPISRVGMGRGGSVTANQTQNQPLLHQNYLPTPPNSQDAQLTTPTAPQTNPRRTPLTAANHAAILHTMGPPARFPHRQRYQVLQAMVEHPDIPSTRGLPGYKHRPETLPRAKSLLPVRSAKREKQFSGVRLAGWEMEEEGVAGAEGKGGRRNEVDDLAAYRLPGGGLAIRDEKTAFYYPDSRRERVIKRRERTTGEEGNRKGRPGVDDLAEYRLPEGGLAIRDATTAFYYPC